MMDGNNTEYTVKGIKEPATQEARHEVQGFVSMEEFIKQQDANQKRRDSTRKQSTPSPYTLDTLFVVVISIGLIMILLIMARV